MKASTWHIKSVTAFSGTGMVHPAVRYGTFAGMHAAGLRRSSFCRHIMMPMKSRIGGRVQSPRDL